MLNISVSFWILICLFWCSFCIVEIHRADTRHMRQLRAARTFEDADAVAEIFRGTVRFWLSVFVLVPTVTGAALYLTWRFA